MEDIASAKEAEDVPSVSAIYMRIPVNNIHLELINVCVVQKNGPLKVINVRTHQHLFPFQQVYQFINLCRAQLHQDNSWNMRS